ncbi:beta-glucosidase BglX [Paenibacillus sp. MMS18-CY102]|nr:beta-glucosidase BglX [Paenibacillus sp. MMS18-CY102]
MIPTAPAKKQWITPAIREQAEKLLSKMTLEDKVGQMTQFDWGYNPINPETGESSHDRILQLIREGRIGSIFNLPGAAEANELQQLNEQHTDLKIPLVIGRDVIHGYRTVFPIPLAMAAAWNPDIAQQTSAAASTEALTDGVTWVFAPMIDVSRDPRWGRIAESIGEDPYLTAAYARAWVEGSQIDNGPGRATASCPKHFAGYGMAEAGRDYNTVDLSDRELRDIILPPFQEAVEAGALSIMASFNEINGIPACANEYLLKTILRDEWGFEGVVASDYNALVELIVHGVAANEEEACEMTVLAGCDMDMHSGIFDRQLPKLVRAGRVPESVVDDAVRRILAMKIKLSLLEQSKSDESQSAATLPLKTEYVELAREAARQSIVLLQNHDQVLPLGKSGASIAVIGPLADNATDPLGCWALDGRQEEVVTALDGIRQAVGADTAIHYTEGCGIDSDSEEGFEAALAAARNSDVVVMVLGESALMSGESRSRTELDLPGKQRALVEAVAKLGKPIVAVILSGRPLTFAWLPEQATAIVQAWHLGVQSGNAIADVLFGDFNPSGRLPVTFPRSVGQIPIYHYRKKTGRPPGGPYSSYYIDSTTDPLYPFGYGLTYTTFEYGAIRMSKTEIGASEQLDVTVTIRNAGEVACEEVVQCYVRDEVASVTQPLKRLVAFRKAAVAAGESVDVTFTIGAAELTILDKHMNRTVEPGDFTLWIGPSAGSGESVTVTVKK